MKVQPPAAKTLNESIVRQSVLIIMSGNASVYFKDKSTGEEVEVHKLITGNAIGISSLFQIAVSIIACV